MMPDLSKLYHQASKDPTYGRNHGVPLAPHDWPEAWKTIEYKTYPRLERIALPDTAPPGMLSDALKKRRSIRTFSGDPVSLDVLGPLLKYSCGIIDGADGYSRAYPSAGARFPIEAYPIVFSGTSEAPSGLYHYDVKAHALEVLWPRAFSESDMAELFSLAGSVRAGALIVLTAVFRRSHMKYGERAYRYMLTEAGHVGQNLYLNSTALGLSCCALGHTNDGVIERLLDVDGVSESLVYAVAIG